MKGWIIPLFISIILFCFTFLLAIETPNLSQTTSSAQVTATGQATSPLCGNGVLNQNEQCDWGAFNGKPCIPSDTEVCFYCTVNCVYGTLSKEPVTGAGTGTSSECNDSDGGADIFVKGTTTGYLDGGDSAPYKGTYSDYCQDSQIVELSCMENSLINYAPRSCPEGYSCFDGACVEREKVPRVLIENRSQVVSNSGDEAICNDSDYGLSIYIKGKITYSNNPQGIVEEYDSCSTGETLIERTCVDAKNPDKNFQEYECIKGCSEGACKKSFFGIVLQKIKKLFTKR